MAVAAVGIGGMAPAVSVVAVPQVADVVRAVPAAATGGVAVIAVRVVPMVVVRRVRVVAMGRVMAVAAGTFVVVVVVVQLVLVVMMVMVIVILTGLALRAAARRGGASGSPVRAEAGFFRRRIGSSVRFGSMFGLRFGAVLGRIRGFFLRTLRLYLLRGVRVARRCLRWFHCRSPSGTLVPVPFCACQAHIEDSGLGHKFPLFRCKHFRQKPS